MTVPQNPAALLAATAGTARADSAHVAGLAGQVRQHREKAVAGLRELDPATADWVAGVHGARQDTPGMVVVGETNRGKSSLVNALLAAPGLSPVDAQVATATYLVCRYAPEWQAHACYPGQPPVPFDLGELVRWVSATAELPPGQLPPRYVEIGCPVPLLTRLRIVDTPGVGGLDQLHGELALEAAAQATALLFVVDASAPFTSGELRFLRRVGERVETVLFALTKTDQFRGWRQVLDADRALLAQHAPRFADATFYPVSARLFEQATKAPNPQAAALLREKSGVAELQLAVQERLVGRAAMLAEANTLRALSTVYAELAVKLAAEQRTLSTGEAEADSLRARRDELIEKRRESTRGWQVRLRGEISKARLAANHEVTKQVRDLTTWFRREIDGASRDTLPQLPAQVDAGLQVVSQRISTVVGQVLNQVAETALADLFTAEELDLLRAQFNRADAPPVIIRPPDKRPSTAEDKLLVFMGMSSGLGLGRIAAMPLAGIGATAALMPVLLPATIVVGLGAGWWMARTRKHAQDKQFMKQWLSDAIAEGRSTLDQLVAQQLIDAEQELSLALDDAITKRITAIEDEQREVADALKLDATERSKRLSAVARKLAEVESGRQRTDALLDRVRALGHHG